MKSNNCYKPYHEIPSCDFGSASVHYFKPCGPDAEVKRRSDWKMEIRCQWN